MAFVERVTGEYNMANVPTEPSGITVVDYPDDCDMYSQTIMGSMDALQ